MHYPEFGVGAVILGNADLWQAKKTSHANRFDVDYVTNSLSGAIYYSYRFPDNLVHGIAMRHAYNLTAVFNQVLRER